MAPPMRFVIPDTGQRKDLLKLGSTNQYVVENEYSIRELKTKLLDTQVSVRQKGSQFVLDGGFDVIFSVLELFNKEIPQEYKSSAFEILTDGMDDLIRQIDGFINGGDLANEREKLNLANRLKMLTYLLCQLMELIEADVLQKESANLTAKNKRKKNAADDENWNWDGKRNEAIHLLYRLLHLNISAIFDPPIVEEEIINLIGNCVFRVFENPSIAHQRLKDVRTGLIQVLGVLISKHGYSLSCRLKIVQSLKHFEHSAAPFAEAVQKIASEPFNCRGFVMDVIREITRIDSKELSRDTSGTRAFSQFLVEISLLIPEQLQPCLSLLQIHLDGDSYMLRKSILSESPSKCICNRLRRCS